MFFIFSVVIRSRLLCCFELCDKVAHIVLYSFVLWAVSKTGMFAQHLFYAACGILIG